MLQGSPCYREYEMHRPSMPANTDVMPLRYLGSSLYIAIRTMDSVQNLKVINIREPVQMYETVF